MVFGLCNELWLRFITVSFSDEFMSGMHVCGRRKGQRDVHERRDMINITVALSTVSRVRAKLRRMGRGEQREGS